MYSLTGETVEMAQAINIPVVNVQWLNDITSGTLLGFYTPINELYFRFDLYDPFKVNYEKLSNLMGKPFVKCSISIPYAILTYLCLNNYDKPTTLYRCNS